MRRILTALAVVELASLAVLLINLGTVHIPEVATVLGPIHGCAYLRAIVLAGMQSGWWSGPVALSLIPGIGGSLAVTALRRRDTLPSTNGDE